jgi:NAD+ kinase
MNICLFPNMKKDQSKPIGNEIQAFLTEKKVAVFVEDSIAAEFGALPLSTISMKDIDFFVTLGGDGTILRLVHTYPDLEAPIIGVNLGSLGFMADIPIKEILTSLQDVLDGKYYIHERIMMQGKTDKNDLYYAVNEIVIHRAQNPCLIDLAIYVDDSYLNTFSADGIIISTPSGSTAYSMAAGGPIVSPQLEAFVITPICPHTISNRPIVLMPKHEMRIEYISQHAPVEVTYDGFPKYTIESGENFYIQKAARKFRLVSLWHHDYFATLRKKLGWSGKIKV